MNWKSSESPTETFNSVPNVHVYPVATVQAMEKDDVLHIQKLEDAVHVFVLETLVHSNPHRRDFVGDEFFVRAEDVTEL